MTKNEDYWEIFNKGFDEGFEAGAEEGFKSGEDSAWEEIMDSESVLSPEEIYWLKIALDRLFEVFNIQVDFTDTKQQDVCKELYDYLGYVAPGMKV